MWDLVIYPLEGVVLFDSIDQTHDLIDILVKDLGVFKTLQGYQTEVALSQLMNRQVFHNALVIVSCLFKISNLLPGWQNSFVLTERWLRV